MKEKISAFEFAIMQIADPVQAEKYKPYTPAERMEMRLKKIQEQAKKFKYKP